MRLSKLFKLSFVGTLIFSPGMAQQAEDVHDQALKVLRGSETNRANTTAAAPATRGPETRSEREARLKEQARQAMEERDRAQAEKRRQFEEYVKERERLRQQKAGVDTGVAVHDKALEVLRQTPAPAQDSTVTATPVSPAPVAPPTATPAPAVVAPAAPSSPSPTATPQSSEDIQRRALEILRQQRAEPATSAVPVTEAEVAPRVTAPTATTEPSPAVRATPSGDNADVHQKALEVLRQQQAQSSSPASGSSLTPSSNRSIPPAAQDDLKPSPELQKRLDEMQRELQREQQRSSVSPAVDEAYKSDLEQRAREMMRQRTPAPVASTAPVTTPAPRLDPQTSEIIRRQNEQLSNQGNAAAGTSSARATLDPSAESRAREILRQQQQAAAVIAPSQPTAQAPVQTRTPAPATNASTVPSASSSAGSDVQYSRELEERARQILMQRQGQLPAATAATSTPAPATGSQEAAAAAAAAAEVSRAPITTDPELKRVHSRALETLVQIEPGDDGQARLKSKQERLRALTDLYRADRMTPAEYHQRRAQIIAEDK